MVNDGSANRSGSRNQNIADFWKLIKPLILVEKFPRNEGIWSTSEGADFIERYISLLCGLFFENAFAHGDRTKLSQLTLFPSGYSRQETSSWEQRKFSDLTDRVSIQSNDPNLPQVEYEDIISGEGALNKDLNDKEGGKTGIKFYVGDVLYGKLRPYLMNWLYPQFNGVAVGDFWVLRATECDSSFLYRLVQTDGFQRLANVSSGSKMPRADWNLISQSFFAVPANHAEQKAIAKSLAELDSLITLHQ